MVTNPAATKPGGGGFASLYADLLASALAASNRTTVNPGESLLEVERRRKALVSTVADGGPPTASGALSAQVAYDVALIRYAGTLGLEVGPGDFEPPARGRQRLEEELGMAAPRPRSD